MKAKNLFTSSLLLVMFLFSCGNKQPTKADLMVGKWRFFSLNLVATTGSEDDKLTEKFYQDMAKNTQYTFEKDGNYLFSSTTPESGTWKITEDGKTISLTVKASGEKRDFTVVNLTQKELVYTFNGTAYKYLRRDEEEK
ncbi:MAG: lipocalin family protein [Bacteroidota bacterium]